MNLTSTNVKKIMGTGVMTAGEIASAGGWEFYETAAFMQSVSTDEVESRSGFECFNCEGKGTAYKWVCGEKRDFKRAKNLTPAERDNMLLEYMKTHRNCSIMDTKDTGLSFNQLSKATASLVKKGILVKSRSGFVYTFNLTD